MRRLAAAFALLFAMAIASPLAGLQKGDERLKGLQPLIATMMREWKIPGCALAIVEKDRVLFAGGFGYRDLKSKNSVDEHTVFSIASCTKAFTAALIGILADEGKIGLDRPATECLPFLRFSDPLLTLQVTPRDMLAHRTGIPGHVNSWHGSENVPRESLVRLFPHFAASAGLRERFQYNNYMYTALGAMAEHVEGGKTWEEQIRERFFGPLDMSSSSASAEHLQGETIACPHEVTFDMEAVEVPFEPKRMQNMGPCGSIFSNVVDMAKWLSVWINEGKLENRAIIPDRFYSQAISTQWGSPSGPSGSIQYLGYGFGWNIALYRGHYSVFHGGGGNGFTSLVMFLPADHLGLVLLANTRAADALMIIANFLCDKLLRLPYTDWNANQVNAYLANQKSLKDRFLPKGDAQGSHPPSHPLVDYCGTYAHPGYGKLTLFLKGGSLRGEYGSMKVSLRHENHDAFTAFVYQWEELFGKMDVVNRPAVFRQNSKGDIAEVAILLERAVDPIVFRKSAEPVSIE